MVTSVFADYQHLAWPHRFATTLHVSTLEGGNPRDKKVAEAWLKTKLADKDDLLREEIAKLMVEEEIDRDEAAKRADERRHLNGFKRDEHGLYIEGRQIKACLKEAVSITVAAGKWDGNFRAIGETRKWLTNYFPEHVFVTDDKVYLERDGQRLQEPSGVTQRFVHTWRGSSIHYAEYAEFVDLSFTVISDHDFTTEQWGMLWATAEMEGTGASRSQGFGTFKVTRWDRQPAKS
jgi:hypothetical protein